MRTTILRSRSHTIPASRRFTTLVTCGIIGFTSLTAMAPVALADEVASSPKGIVGGALLGGGVVTIVQSLAGVHAGWAYGLGGGLGAVAGGVGGFFIDKGSSNGLAPTYVLAGGLAIIIPAIVLTLNATRYMPSETATEDKPPVDAPVANPGAPAGSVLSPTASPPPAAAPAPGPAPAPTPAPPASPGAPATSLVDVQGGALRLGVPVPDVRPMYSLREQKEYGLPQRTELRMPVLAVTF